MAAAKEIPTTATTMRALTLSQGEGHNLKLVNSWPIPAPNRDQGEYLIRVSATALTRGELTWPIPTESYKDYSPGVEMAGEVVVVSPPAGSRILFPVGSKVCMRTTFPNPGSAREYVIGSDRELALQPCNVTPEQAASIPVSALTAWQALFVQAGFPAKFLDNGDEPSLSSPSSTISQIHTTTTTTRSTTTKKKILIVGASGSCGLWVVQLARLAGFYVVGTSHTRNIALVQSLGAHAVIDYTQTSIAQWLADNQAAGTFDLVFDCVSPGDSFEVWHAARPDYGIILSIVLKDNQMIRWTIDRPEGVSDQIKGKFFIMENNSEQLRKIVALVEAGKVRPIVDSVFDLEDYAQAFERVESGKATGKVVLRIN